MERIVSLDLLRGIAAFGVAISHFFYLSSNSLVAEALSTVFVEIFFPLSGFVLASQILKCRNDGHSLQTFLVRRWMRTVPPYLVAVLCAALIYGRLWSGDFVLYATFLQDAWPNIVTTKFYNVAWSLSIEEFFYLLFPLVVIFGARHHVISALIFIAIFQIARIVLAGEVEVQYLRIGTFLRLDSIAFGFLAHVALNGRRLGAKWCLSALAVGIAAAIALYFLYGSVLAGDSATLVRLVYINCLSVFGVSVLVLFISANGMFAWASPIRQTAAWIGKISYPVYLFHILILQFILDAVGVTGLPSLALYLGALTLFTLIFHVYFEQPILERRPAYVLGGRGVRTT
jgi:peptidoglycan/LPS O-acetylase OafA/YrhL